MKGHPFICLQKVSCRVISFTSKINGQQYIGSSEKLYERLHKEYFNIRKGPKGNRHILMALKEQGINQFTLCVMGMLGRTKQDAFVVEQYILFNYIVYYNTNRITDTIKGYKHSPEMIEKIRAERGQPGGQHRWPSGPAHTCAGPVHVYRDGVLLQSFLSYVEFSAGSSASKSKIREYIDSGELWRGKYILHSTLIDPDEVPLITRDEYTTLMQEERMEGAKSVNKAHDNRAVVNYAYDVNFDSLG